MQRGFDALLRHHHRRRQLLRPEHADARQREHRARGARRPASSTPTRSATTPVAFIEQHCAASTRPALLRVRRLHRAALAAARARRGHRQVPRPLRRRLGPAARGAARQARRRAGILKPDWKLTERDPSAAAVDRGRAGRAVPRLDAALHGGLRGADRPHGPGHRPPPRHAREARPARQHAGDLPRRQRRLRRGHPAGRDHRRARRQAHDRAQAHAQRRAGALRQRRGAHARPGEHVPELRHGLGQPLEQPVPPLQALDPRRAASPRR